MKKWHIPFLLLLIIGTIFIAREQHKPQTFQEEEGNIFGTVFHVTYESDTSLLPQIMSELHRVDNSLSMFNPSSTISKLNSGETELTDSLVRIVFALSQQISKATNGAFDVTVAPLVNAWGFGFKHQQLPDSTQVDSLLPLVNWRNISIDKKQRLIKSDPRMILDFSAIAKGFGADLVASLFRRHNIENFMIEIGGEIVLNGTNPKGQPWRIGISKPDEKQNGQLQQTITLNNGAMATSGNYRNFYTTKDGKRLAHTIDPRTGYPVQHSILSATVLAPTCAMADAFATSFMVLGLDSAQSILKSHPELQAYFIIDAGNGNYSTATSSNWEYNVKD